MSFERKKIQIETLSEYLTEVRKSLNFSINQVSDQTGIKPKFLSALEAGDFSVLPADVYVMGFLNQLAKLYAVDVSELIGQYKKEKGIHKNLVKNRHFSTAGWYKKIFGRFVITPKVLSLALGGAFVSLTFGYIVWQVWSINKAPSLEVHSPADFSVLAGSAMDVSGATDPGMNVAINGEDVFVDSQGHFKTQLGLAPGPKEISIVAKNRFGKTVSKTLTVTAAGYSSGNQTTLELKINFIDSVNLTFAIDDQPPQNLNFSTGDAKTFTARNKILISTSNAGATLISLNGQDLGVMGKPNEVLVNVPFIASFGNQAPVDSQPVN